MFIPSADIYMQYLRVQYTAWKNDTEPAIKANNGIRDALDAENCVFPVWRAELFITKHFSRSESE